MVANSSSQLQIEYCNTAPASRAHKEVTKPELSARINTQSAAEFLTKLVSKFAVLSKAI